MTTGTIQMPEKIQLDESTRSATFGRFIVQPLEKGFGVTIGNAMRRVLLSSLPGYAITAFRVDGVQHEFSTIPGVVEDVPGRGPQPEAGADEADQQEDQQGGRPPEGADAPSPPATSRRRRPTSRSSTPSLHIATLNPTRSSSWNCASGRGIGYVTAEENKTPEQPTGV